MSERLTASLEDGTLEKLRTLAGGERKVGAYLSDVVAWLWYHREQLQTQPLQSFAPVLEERIPRVTMSAEELTQAQEAALYWRKQATHWLRSLQTLQAEMKELDTRISATETTVIETQRALETIKQDSGQNDA